ncbi:MAG: single-stranded DNA-binding protein [Selenomonadaceae bacterium]|nr:single-stranded DNA-binding protein [Selenomonadaceae bacterium]
MNKVILSGNLARDPEVRYSQSGTAYAKSAIAVNRPFSSKSNEGQTTVDFFNFTVFGKQAEFCGRYMKKGSSVIIEGRIENDNYEDKNGVKRYAVNIMVEHIEFAGKKSSGDNSGGNYNNSNEENNSGGNYDGGDDDVDVPF